MQREDGLKMGRVSGKKPLPRSATEVRVWRAAVLEALQRGGPVCRHAAQYILDQDVRIGFSRQGTGGRWTLRGEIELSSSYYSLATDPGDARLLGAVVHEATHLEQGAALALSVQGEVGAWKAEYEALTELRASPACPHWKAVALSSREPASLSLREARSRILRRTGHRYLIWLLPVRPNLWTRLVARVQWSLFGKGDRA
jgi:hypothetical protein